MSHSKSESTNGVGIAALSFATVALLVSLVIRRRRRLEEKRKAQLRGYNPFGDQNIHLDDELKEEENALEASGGAMAWALDDGPFKLVLIVNMELKMGRGKVVAQCCHATLGSYKLSQRHCPSALRGWEEMGQAKICLKCPTEMEMYDIQARALAEGLVTYLVVG